MTKFQTNVSKPEKPPAGPSGISPDHDPVNHPAHYASEAKCSSCGASIECIDIVRHMPFNIGNAIERIWWAGKKDEIVQDLRKAIWHIEDQIAMIEGTKNQKIHRLNVTPREENEAAMRKYEELMKERKSGVNINNYPECKFGQGILFGKSGHSNSYGFCCKTHDYLMVLPIDKAPEHCARYESET